jgi:predicted TIM-barrel fold metal-dependent hydrolase
VSTIVDSHTHIWRPPSEPVKAATIVSPVCDVPIELLEQYLLEYGVGRALLIQPVFRAEDNEYVAASAAVDPDRLAAVCVVDPRRPGAIDRLRYWSGTRGCKGMRLRPRIPDEAILFGDPDTFPVWDYASNHGLVISVYAGPEHLPTIAMLASRFPDVAIVIDHMAHPAVQLGVDAPQFRDLLTLSRHPRVFVKVSGYYYFSGESYPYRNCWEFFRRLYEHFGPSRLVWGSDFPHVLLRSGYRRSLLLHERIYHYLSAEDLNLIMGGNAAMLYWGESR